MTGQRQVIVILYDVQHRRETVASPHCRAPSGYPYVTPPWQLRSLRLLYIAQRSGMSVLGQRMATEEEVKDMLDVTERFRAHATFSPARDHHSSISEETFQKIRVWA